tara:strand:- start:306 stop:2342 length:2037 start_codon:yes stop_codon:yes gene_type:complete
LKLLTIIQARYSSSRLPGKVLRKYKNISYLELLIKRLQKSNKIKKVIVAATSNPADNEIEKLCNKLKVFCFRGSEDDVIDRYFQVSKFFKAKNIVRITADCPLIDSKIADEVIKNFFLKKVDYATNTMPPTFPDGMDVEVFNFTSLKKSWKVSRLKKELREHVTTYIRDNACFSKINIKYKKDYSFLRLTLDESEDEKVLNLLLGRFSNIFDIEIDDIIKLYKKDRHIFQFNKHIRRNEGRIMSTGQKVWKRAQKIIPGGTMLFSKNPDLFLPEKWPAYFSKSRGYKIWDLDENCFADLSFMGVGTNTLGYSNSKIEKKVLKTIKNGNMTTLNSLEEIQLAEKLIELHPWADMARFTRSGGEANAVAIRIARAASGKDKIAVCGYHGWHDWYLASNIKNKSGLDEHLMSNVPIDGVPKNLKNTVFPFSYNNFEELTAIVEKNDIGVIKMEVKRNDEPKNNFLQKVRKLSKEKNIVLIFDECTSGFRQTFGGLHKFYNVNPDMAIFGKALGNGYAINAIIGKRSVMESVKSTFISSTFWTERIGPTAALETLKIMEDIKSWKIISDIGNKIKKNWEIISSRNSVQIDIRGIDAIPNFSFRSKNNLLYKTLITQEMLKNNIFASNVVYCCILHDDNILKKYFNILDDTFLKIKKVESGKFSIYDFLTSKVCIAGLRTKNN